MSKCLSVRSRLLAAAAFTSSTFVLAIHPAAAQQSAPAQPATQGAATAQAGPATYGDDNAIVVTAQRRAERSRDVPVSITAIGADQIRQAGLRQLNDIAKVTPGLRFDYVGTFVQPTIRGIGTSFATSGGLGNVAIYVDGFYSPNPLGADFQLANVENI